MAKIGLPKIKFTRRNQLIGLLILLVLVGVVWFTLSKSGSRRLINAVEIKILPENKNAISNQQEISNLISGTIGNPVSHAANEINLTLLETNIKKLAFVQQCQVYVSLDGKLKIQIIQRNPVVRIYNTHGEVFFLDTAGFMIPMESNYAPDVVIANGNITEKMQGGKKISSAILKNVLAISIQISEDEFWNAQFEQLYVDNYSDIILIPRVGKHSIVVGNAENLDEKFQNLRVFYEKGLNTLGWDKYKILSLKYKGQVVGIKNSTQTTEQKK